MLIPSQFCYEWTGEVIDTEENTHPRRKPYRGKIVLNATGGSSEYTMTSVEPVGTLTILKMTETRLELKEHFPPGSGGRNGIIKAELNDDGTLQCIWSYRQNPDLAISTATMTHC